MLLKMLISSFVLILFVSYSAHSAEDAGSECIYDDAGLCVEPCPPDTTSYTSNCVDAAVSQATCRAPQQRSLGLVCDLSRCDCRPPLLWDEAAEKCVRQEKCSDQSALRNKIQRK